jgi:hypothetical protein
MIGQQWVQTNSLKISVSELDLIEVYSRPEHHRIIKTDLDLLQPMQ